MAPPPPHLLAIAGDATIPDAGVVRQLQADIIFGRIAPGSRLIEDTLMGRFGVSRHYVRQALDQLERRGLAMKERNKGFTVRSLTPQEVAKIYEVRELVQRQAALTIPLPAPADVIEKLRAINEELIQHMRAGDLSAVHEANDRFHLVKFAACSNEYLVATIEHYMQLSLPVRAKTLADPERLRESLAHHRLMIDMLQGRDNWVLAQLCVDHLQPSKRDYLSRTSAPTAEGRRKASQPGA